MAAAFHGAMNSKCKLGRKNGPKRTDTAGSIGPGRSTRYEKRQDAKAQRRKAADGAQVAERNDSDVTVRPAWRVICSDPQYSGGRFDRSDFPILTHS